MIQPLHQRLPAEHHEADELFLKHQEALLERDFAAAAARLAEFTEAVSRHIAVEEAEAIPLYCAHVPTPPPGGHADLILAEHRKIERYLRQFAEQLAAWQSRPPTPREVLALLDRQTQFKHLMDHHDRRERSFLYAALASIEGDGGD